jgi:WD40 repeat protein
MLFVFPLVLLAAPAEAAKAPLPEHAIRRLQVEQGPVIALSPDGKILATAGVSGKIRLWNPANGEEVRGALEGHEGAVHALAFASDNKRLVSGGADRSLRLWDVTTGKELWKTEAHRGMTGTVAIAPDGKLIASGGGDKTIRIWDASDGSEKMHLDGHRQEVFTLAYSPDGHTLASGSRDRTIMLWNTRTGKLTHHLKGHKSWVTCLAAVPDGPAVISGGRDQTIRFWDAWNGQTYLRLGGWSGEIRDLAMTQKGKVVVSGDANGAIRFYHVGTGQELLQPWKGHGEGIAGLAVSAKGDTLASVDRDGVVFVWKLSDLPEPKEAALSEEELQKHWATLTGDGFEPEVYLAMRRMVFAPDKAIPFLKKQLPPVPADQAARCAKLIKDLNDDDFQTRKTAENELLKQGAIVVPMLQEALMGQLPTLEVRRLMTRILEQLPVDELRSRREREVRILQVLERIGSAEARAYLKELAGGGAAAPLTRDAKVTLEKLERQKK